MLSVAPWFPISYPVLRLLLAGAGADGVDLVFGAAGGGFGVDSGVDSSDNCAADDCAADDCFALDLLPCAEDPAPALPASGTGLAADAGGRVAFAGVCVS